MFLGVLAFYQEGGSGGREKTYAINAVKKRGKKVFQKREKRENNQSLSFVLLEKKKN